MSCFFTVNKCIGAVSGKAVAVTKSGSNSPKKKNKGSECPPPPRIEIVREEQPPPPPLPPPACRTPSSLSPAPSSLHSPSSRRRRTASTSTNQCGGLCCQPAPIHVMPHPQVLLNLQGEVEALRDRLEKVTHHRDFLDSALGGAQLERLRLSKERDEQLESQSARYEERLVELHSVIAELTRQLEERARESIREEEEEEEGEEEDTAREELDSRTSTDIIDAEAVEAGERMLRQGVLPLFGRGNSKVAASATGRQQQHQQPSYPDLSFLRLTATTTASTENVADWRSGSPFSDGTSGSFHALALQEELSDAKERNLQLSARLQRKEADLEEARGKLEEAAREKDELLKRVREVEDGSLTPALERRKGGRREAGEFKVAERRKLQKTKDEGAKVFPNGVRSSFLAEHLAKSVQETSSLDELSSALTGGEGAEGRAAGKIIEEKICQFEVEIERMSSRIENLRAQNDLLEMSLAESKENSEELTVLMGKYESNHTAHKLIASYSDHIIECFETLVALSGEDGGGGRPCFPERRKRIEMDAQRLLKRLEETANRPDSGLSIPSAGDEDSPRQGGEQEEEDSSGYSQTNSSLGSGGERPSPPSPPPPAPSEDHAARLSEYIARLKASKASVEASVTDLETLHMERACWEEKRSTDSRGTSSKRESQSGQPGADAADLEMAVLVQELMALKEERCDLRAHVFELEREREAAALAVSAQQAQEDLLRSQVEHLLGELDRLRGDKKATTTRPSAEMLGMLDEVKRTSETQQRHQDGVIKDLRKTNESLNATLERTKKKYQSRLKQLEQQISQHLMKEQFGKDFADVNSRSYYSCLSTETEQTE